VKGPRRHLSAAEKAERIIEELCSEKRFLTLFEWDRQPAYVFPHRSILEFLAGAELAEKLNSDRDGKWWDFVDRMAWDPGWEGVLLFATGQLGERVNDLARRLLDGEDDIFRHRLSLAAMCLAEAPLHVRLEKLVDRITAEVWHFQSSEVSDPVWVLARETLDKLHHTGSAWVAAGKLNGKIREKLNGKVKEAKLLELLVQQVKQGEERAIWLAGRLGTAATQSPDLVASLLQTLRSNSLRWVAAEALKNLGAHLAGHPATITALAEALERYGHRGHSTWISLSEALCKAHGTEALNPIFRQALLNGLRSDNRAKRAEAAQVIGRLGDAVATDGDLMSALLSAFRDDDRWVRFSATTALAELGDACLRFRGTMPSLLDALKSDDAEARRNAAIVLTALHEVGSWKSQVTEALLDALRREDHAGPTAISLGRALHAVGGEEAVGHHLIPMILRYLQAQGRWHLTAAADLVAEMAEVVAKNDPVIEALLLLRRHADSDVRLAVTNAFGKCAVVRFQDDRLVAGLRAAMKDCSPRVRATALDRLGELIESFGAARVLQDKDLTLIKKVLLEHRIERVRSSAIRLVGKLGELVARDQRVVEALLDGLSNLQWTHWEVAAEALAELGRSVAKTPAVLERVAALSRDRRIRARRVLVGWDNQGLRIFRSGDGFTVRTIAELTQPSRT
jgi:HEAT repeat protein